MISAGQAFVDAVSQSSRRFRMRLFYGSNEIDGIIRNAKIHLGSSGPDSFSVGAVYSAFAEIVLDGRNTSLEGKELRLDVGVMTDEGTNTYSDITLGHFTVLRPAATKYRTTFTAVGRITSKLAVTEFTAPATMTLANIASAITQLTGVTIAFAAGVDTSGLIEYPITGNCRDALTALAIAVGGYATETNVGGILIDRYNSSTSTASYGPDTMQALPEIGDYDFEITGVQAITPTGLYEEGDPINVSIESNYVTEELFEDFASDLIGFSYRPGSVALSLGDPRIEPKDVLEISTPDEETYIMPCLAITHIFDGGFQTEITTPAVQTVGEVVGTMGAAVKEAAQKAEQASEAADDARKVAVNYLARDSTGIMVADMSGGTAYTPSTVPAGVKNTFIDNDSFDVRDGTTSIASFGLESRVGLNDTTHIKLYSEGFGVFDDNGTRQALIGAVSQISIEVSEEHTAEPLVETTSRIEIPFPFDFTKPIRIDDSLSGNSLTLTYGVTRRKVSFGTYIVNYDGRYIIYITHWSLDVIIHYYEFRQQTVFGFTLGTRTTVNPQMGDHSISVGSDNFAGGDNCGAIGTGLWVSEDDQVVVGRYNTANIHYALAVGTGTGLNEEKTAFAVTWYGDTLIDLDINASSGTVDGRLYQAICDIGIQSEVIV